MTKHHNTTSRYYPVTKKDHERDLKKEDFCECQDEGMDTHTHTSRYVPAGGKSKLTEWVHGMDKAPDTNLKSNWLGINIHNEQL
mmetsp:Transcript_26057/g.60139  ORF Transcript_26057/g.60139 Transcript_26057/m.60139 type:complete len:84 (-) Transcript_26057:166-417(-)|eukprot:CAMPEP_0176190542 /NCGR_PEP_ID=MMETSP0121_2-20121125/3991_1 /TAXON_ID=160619 /ORGANISM="Kryptoperidinium foliaceum, Strain CCMP 1326" /LENGTH=83 /DNA_ID=CAMNT_0017529165 /DNA_START=194 /DNA_END=445 /DNA_ORIENTATION=+